MTTILTESARSGRFSRVQQVACWSFVVIILSVACPQEHGARAGVASSSRADSTVAETERPKETVRAELARIQKQTGLTLASFGFGLDVALFDKRTLVHSPIPAGFKLMRGTISRDGTEIIVGRFILGASDSLEFLRSDGSGVREIPFTYPQDVASHIQSLCWSYDKSRLAMIVHHGFPEAGLEVMDLGSGVSERIAPNVIRLTSQCWSPDGKKIVYEAGDGVRIYELGNDESSTLLVPRGKGPTWSPDGNWIAFLDHDTYYAIRPDGQNRRKLFHRKEVYSELWWSPDSRFVAYVALARFAVDDVYELRVRRLEDNSDDWVAGGQVSGEYQWVTSPQLLERVESGAISH